MQKAGGRCSPLVDISNAFANNHCLVIEKESLMNTQGINSAAHAATLKGKINALEVRIINFEDIQFLYSLSCYC